MPSLFRTISFVIIFSVLSLAVFPVMAKLDTVTPGQATTLGVANPSVSLLDKVNKVVQFFLKFLGIVAIVAIMYGGFLYLTSAGDDKKAAAGKQVVIYAVIGIILVMLSAVIVNTVLVQIR